MTGRVLPAAVVMVVLLAARAARAAEPALAADSGVVVKANANLLILRPRLSNGRFGTALVLKATGTSTVSIVSVYEQAGQRVVRQQNAALRQLQPARSLLLFMPSRPTAKSSWPQWLVRSGEVPSRTCRTPDSSSGHAAGMTAHTTSRSFMSRSISRILAPMKSTLGKSIS